MKSKAFVAMVVFILALGFIAIPTTEARFGHGHRKPRAPMLWELSGSESQIKERLNYSVPTNWELFSIYQSRDIVYELRNLKNSHKKFSLKNWLNKEDDLKRMERLLFKINDFFRRGFSLDEMGTSLEEMREIATFVKKKSY